MRSGGVFDLTTHLSRPGITVLKVSEDRLLRQESGGHRWQRVSPTEKRGRVHTSTITVAVMDAMCAPQIELHDSDLVVTKYRGSGKGGQHRNKTDSAVRLLHKPSGIIVCSEQERSQHKNMAIARAELKRRLETAQLSKVKTQHKADRHAQVGSGMRGDKRRTIRMQDDTVTDHQSGKTCRASDYLKGRLELLV